MLSQIKALVLPKTKQSAILKREGDGHLKAERMDAAEEAYRLALSLDPRNVEACIGLAYVFSERSDLPSARETLTRAAAMDPANADAHYMLGTIARQEGDGLAAARHFERAIECRPGFLFAYRDLFAVQAQSGQGERAFATIERAAAACPASPDVHGMHGRMLAARGNYAGAIASFRKACSLAPQAMEYHRQLADLAKATGDTEQAIASYRWAVELDPRSFECQLALADELQRLGRHGEAVAHYREALAIDPRSSVAHVNMGVTLQAQGKLDEAIGAYRRATEMSPRMAAAHANLGHMLAARGANEEAIACYEKVLEIDPASTVAHTLAGLKGGEAERAPDAYVAKLFDWYAASFDTHLVQTLQYDIPGKIAQLLAPLASSRDWAVLDLGCGTGLVGSALSSIAGSLVGVDLSPKMLAKARERGIYQRLEQLDVCAMMEAEPPARYDLVVAADVFVYIGKLDAIATEAQRILRPGMYFAFSVESLEALTGGAGEGEGRDYRLTETGRFAHAAGYLARLCARSGFENLSTIDTRVRVSQGKPVEGYLVLWRKHRAAPAAAPEPAPGNFN